MTAENIAAFYRAWCHPNNATLIVAGDIDAVQTLAEIHELFDSIPTQPLPALQGVIDEYEQDGVPPELVAAAKSSLLSEASYTPASIPSFAFGWSAALLAGYDSPSV